MFCMPQRLSILADPEKHEWDGITVAALGPIPDDKKLKAVLQ